MARVCDGDTAYLFGFPWSEQQDGPIYGADDDTLAAYDLTLLELAKGAKKTQDTYGFAKNIDDSSKSAITKNYEDPSSSTDLFVGIPLCDLDAIEDFWRSHKDDWDGIIMTAQGTAQYIAQQSCAQYNITIDSKTQSWPLSEKDFPTKRLWL
ncbi:hypothetical protein N7509_000734 [Penicillium cosmopolitanum]|uniref:Uncharacterized protein n=1 Tax=Penicillium cosmopolitanum TaxID=1131564 RepID=A0A9X0BEC8_9EURO|nr:uncharacterized protein N7509_000734 [Penicillium cosmopolitanum]KAJ5414107.1 hypothetical protein N7509_000734 [Penicillium cosmopolitanum]